MAQLSKGNGSYAPLGIGYYRDDAVLEAGERAELLFVRGLAYCAEAPTDGFITDRQLTFVVAVGFRDALARATKLVEVGLWERVEGGYVVRSWLKWNKTAEQIGRHKAKDRERKAQKASEGIQTDSARNPDGIQTESSELPRPTALHCTTQHDTQTLATAPRSAAQGGRPPDDLFDRLVVECGINPTELTAAARGNVNSALKQLRAVDANPNQITLRSRRFRQQFRDATLTPSALAKHWAALGETHPPAVARGGSLSSVQMQARMDDPLWAGRQ